ncbi:MAG: phosphoribosylglycinamide formyltransferase [Alphaproteobacteria bacterium]|nr:MAG: phosphoribosylglycinamide formyltransferase [Alphaproteobacteria bacterium]
MVALVRAMQEGRVVADPALVLSSDPAAGALQRAAELGVPAAVVDASAHRGDRAGFEAALQRALDAAGAEFICLAGFMRILTPDFVARWQGRMLNIHPSLLPLFPGLDTHARAIASGMAVHGATVHEVTADLDTGPIRGQAIVPIEPGDTPERLAARLLQMEHRLYPLVLDRVLRGETAPILLT